MNLRACTLAAAAFLFGSLGVLAQTPRIARSIDAAGPRAALHDAFPGKALAALDQGKLPGDTLIDGVSLRFSLAPAQQDELTQLLADQQNPASPRYHQWLTPEQYAARFGLAESDLARVSAYLSAQGLTVDATSRSRTFLIVSGTAAQIAAAFGTSLHRVTFQNESHFANLSDPVLPAALAGVTRTVTGLNDFRLKPRVRLTGRAAPDYTAGSGAHFLAPGDLYTIYDLNPLLTSSINGAGITIAVLGQTDLALPSAAAFRAASGLPPNAPAVKLYGADPGTSSADLAEAMLDVEWSGAIAPAATILYVNSTDVIAGSLTNAVDDNLAPILSISYGNCEQDFGAAELATYQQLFRQANAQGQTIVGPAGDTGAADCDYNATVATRGLAVDFPASSPNVTGVGGTMFTEGAGTYFSVTNGAYGGSALSYIPEAAWNETAALGALAGGGGGASAYFTKPPYQTGPGVPNDFSRDVPDLALSSAAAHDGYLICTPGYCTNGYQSSGGYLAVVGGTSVAVPEFAGMLALLEQKNQTRLGNANPSLYALANSRFAGAVFHDVTTDSNAMPCANGSAGCPASGMLGYNAAPGFDLATGWGSVDAYNLVSDWLLVPPPTPASTVASATSLTDSASTVVAGGAITFKATVGSATNGTTSAPSGSVQFLVDSVPTGSPVALAAGTAVYTLSTGGLAPGAHIVTAGYSGDALYAGSKSSVQIGVQASSAVDFALTPGTFSVTTSSGTDAPGLLFTVTSLNGFSGPVTFSASTTSATFSTAGGYTFSPAQINLAAGGSAATELTLAAFHAQNRPAALLLSAILFPSLACFFFPRARRRSPALLLAAAMLSLGGCASSTPTANNTGTAVNTPAGTYTVLVTASGTSSTGIVTSHNATVTFTVQ